MSPTERDIEKAKKLLSDRFGLHVPDYMVDRVAAALAQKEKETLELIESGSLVAFVKFLAVVNTVMGPVALNLQAKTALAAFEKLKEGLK